MNKPKIAIIGAGASGLMVADHLCAYDVDISIYEKMPSAGRKILWAGKTGLNVSHNEPLEIFITRYGSWHDNWIGQYVQQFNPNWLVKWLSDLGVETYVGSSGRIFPIEMKASKFLRAWLNRLLANYVKFYYHHECISIDKNTVSFKYKNKDNKILVFNENFDVIILACGGGSYKKLGSDGKWQAWFDDKELTPLFASNVGIVREWSAFMTEYFGKALKGVALKINDKQNKGDIIISHYGMESGLIYQFNQDMRANLHNNGHIKIHLDLLPDKSINDIQKSFDKNKKQSLNNRLRKIGLDNIKTALLRECTDKADWSDMDKMAKYIKDLPIVFDGFRPMDEAISTGGGVKRTNLTDDLQLKSNPYVFCCGEMLDFDAPTGGYLLTACFATGQVVGQGVVRYLGLSP